MIPSVLCEEVLRRLHAAEQEYSMRVLLAAESGSRAWGFASTDCGYDVRFIYLRPQDVYLSVALEEQRDVIKYAIVDEFDLNGWGIRKALRLL